MKSPLNAPRLLTALTLALLLCATPVLAQSPAHTARTAHAVKAPTQLGIVDIFQNAIANFIAKITTSSGSGGGGVSGPRIDPEGAPSGPGSGSGTGTVGTP